MNKPNLGDRRIAHSAHALAVGGWTLLLVACGSDLTGPEGEPAVRAAVLGITAADLRDRVELIAHDSMQGRATPSAGLEMTSGYIVQQFLALGLRPGGEQDYVQRFPVGAAPEIDAPNVIGWVEGSDPALRGQYVVFSAHMDHVGIGAPINGDSVFNGADDNASGTAAVLELAEAFALLDPKPRRSLMFMTFSGEEGGLIGSLWYTDHPTIPLASTVANINLDMIGRNWTDAIAAISSSSYLVQMAEGVEEDHPELGLRVIEDPWPQRDLIMRSDQYSFVRYGIPGALFTSGLHADYHQRSDEADKIDLEKTARVTRLMFYLGLRLANADEVPD
ncbi:MAG: M28 family peptidase [Planctomycetota bacterium]